MYIDDGYRFCIFIYHTYTHVHVYIYILFLHTYIDINISLLSHPSIHPVRFQELLKWPWIEVVSPGTSVLSSALLVFPKNQPGWFRKNLGGKIFAFRFFLGTWKEKVVGTKRKPYDLTLAILNHPPETSFAKCVAYGKSPGHGLSLGSYVCFPWENPAFLPKTLHWNRIGAPMDPFSFQRYYSLLRLSRFPKEKECKLMPKLPNSRFFYLSF